MSPLMLYNCLVLSQGSILGAPQDYPPALCNEEDQQAEPHFEESDSASFCGERHLNICRKPFCSQHVLLLRDKAPPVHGHGVRRRYLFHHH